MLNTRMIRALVCTSAVLLAVPASADILRETERFERKRVIPGEEVARVVDCPAGYDLTGGGYALYNLPNDKIEFIVTASYPFNDGWRVELRNITDTNQPLTFRVYALCSSD